MRRCRKLISIIVMMAMLATAAPVRTLAAEPASEEPSEVQLTATVVNDESEGDLAENGENGSLEESGKEGNNEGTSDQGAATEGGSGQGAATEGGSGQGAATEGGSGQEAATEGGSEDNTEGNTEGNTGSENGTEGESVSGNETDAADEQSVDQETGNATDEKTEEAALRKGALRSGEQDAYTYEVTYNTEVIDAYANKSYDWLNSAAFEIKNVDGDYIADADILAKYEFRVNGVTSTDSTFVWDGNTSYVLSKKEGVVYTVNFGLYEIESGEQVSGPYTMQVKTYTSSELKDLLDEDDQYITDAYISNYYDGTGPFDADDGPGNDSSPQNDVLRSFDYLQYEISVASASYSEDYYREGYVGYLILLAYEDGSPLESKNGNFSADTLSWMTKNNSISELNAVINGTGTFTVNGKTGTYKYAKGYHYLNATEEDGGSAFPIAGSTVNFDVKIGGLANDTTIKPLMWTWTYPNDVDLKDLKTDYSDPEYDACEEHKNETSKNSGKELVPVRGVRPIRISAAPRYNVQLKQAYAQSHSLRDYNFNTGFGDPAALQSKQHLAPNYGIGTVRGRYYGFGVTLQLYNNSADKGLKGIEIPQGPITFDVKLDGTFTNKDVDAEGNRVSYQMDYEGTESDYLPLLWSWQPNFNYYNGSTRRDGRNISSMYGTHVTQYVGPANDGDNSSFSCYNGGNWNVEQDGATLSFSVNDYEIDSTWFPRGDPPSADSEVNQVYWKLRDGIDKCYIGCFSCCDFWVIVPVENQEGVSLMDHPATDEDGNPITDEEGNPMTYGGKGNNGTYTFSIKDVNLDATSISGQTVKDDENTTSAQQRHNDDSKSYTVDFEKSLPGKYSRTIRYNGAQKASWQYDASNIYPGAINDGRDVAEIGQRVAIGWGMSWNANDSVDNYVYGINALMKFDDSAMYLNSGVSPLIKISVDNGAKTTRTYLFAAKPDGTGWDHKGLKPGEKGYDDEMDKAVETDLVYYSSLAELESDGKVCVGVLAESRMSSTRQTGSNTDEYYLAQLRIKQDPEICGNVYATCNSVTYWTYDKFKKNGQVRIPSRMEVQNGDAEMPAASATNSRSNFTKAVYDEYGNYKQNHIPTGTSTGDSLYIIPYTPKVTKYVAQKNSDGTTKTTFDLDAKQNTVDFAITAELTKQIHNPIEEEISKTTVTLRDTLPKGVTYNGDAVLGGTYEQNKTSGYHGTVTGGVEDGSTLLFTTTDGKQVEVGFFVESVQNSNGTTSLTFTLTDFPIDEGRAIIYYSTDTDSSAKNGDKFTNSVRISTTEVTPSIYDTQYLNLANAAFQVVRASSLSLNKLTEKSFVDIKAEIGYTMTWQNTGKNDRDNYPLFDVLPYNGDSYGTDFNGTYTLDSVTLTNNNGTDTSKITDFTGLEVWYTTDTYIRDVSLEDDRILIHDNDIRTDSRWSQATLHEDGTVTDFSPNTVAFCILAPLNAGKAVQAACVIKPVNNEPGDKYVNTISVISSIASARGIVLNRIVSGLTWYDANDDGVRQAAEKKVAGVKVRLVGKDDFDAATGRRSSDAVTSLAPVVNLKGEQCESVTGADGSYEFANLPAGEFVVVFMDDQTSLSDFIMSQKEVSDAREVNNSNTTSANTADGTIDYGFIYVTMPAASEITASPYRDRYEDMGLVRTSDITATKVWDNADGINTVPDGAEVTFTLTGNGLSLETTLDGTADEELETDSATQASYGESEDWKAAFNDLPRYTIDADGYAVEAEYKVEETEGWENYEVRYSDNASKLKNGDNATITNKIKNGDLEISKTVVSPIPAESTQTFDFAIVLDPAVTMTYNTVTKDSKGTETKGTVSFTEGKQTVTVAGGATLTILELPAGMDYTVTEVAAEGSVFDLTDSSGAEGEIEADKTKTAAFTNTRKTGSLEVTKEVVNKNDTNTAKEFTFTVTLEDTTITGTLGEGDNAATFDKGVTAFTLKDGETKTIDGLPSGIGYTVVETADDGFVTRYEGTTGEDGGDDAEGQAGGTEGQTGGDETDDPEGEPAEGTGAGTEGVTGTIVEKETETVKVINTYMTEGEYTVEVKKVLEGRLLREGQFEFELADSEGVLQTVKNGADGTVKFDPIVFTEEDLEKETEGERAGYFKEKTEKTYTVKEVIPEGAKDNGDGTFTLDGYTYDAKEQTVTVSLKDNGDGTITAEADKKIEDLTFTNIYAADGEVFIGGVKVLEGQDLKEGQFKFVLSDENGAKVLEATNDANGNFEFEGIKYELSDLGGEKEKVFSYGVTEINDGQSNITYDKTAYTVKVTVTDNGDGTLTAKADKSRGEIRFTNKYTPPETPKEDKPKHKKSNNTGDSANGALWALMLLLAGGALAGTIWFRRRKKI